VLPRRWGVAVPTWGGGRMWIRTYRGTLSARKAVRSLVWLAGIMLGAVVLPASLAGAASATEPVSAAAKPPPSWPMFRFGPQHTGVQPSESVLTPVTVRHLRPHWTAVSQASYSLYLNPAESDGVIYTGGRCLSLPTRSACTTFPYRIVALNATTGAMLWSSIVDGGLATGMGVAVAGQVVYVATSSGTLAAYNARTGKPQPGWPIAPLTMTPLIKNRAGATCFAATGLTSPATAPPTVAAGLVFYQTTGGCVFAVAPNPGRTPQLRWFFAGSGRVSAAGQTSPAVANGRVFVGTSRGWAWALSQATGVPIWKKAVDTRGGGQVASSPSVAGSAAHGSVYLQAAGGTSPGSYALSTASGKVRWHDAYGGLSSPAVYRGQVYICGGTHVYAVSAANGRIAWAFSAGDNVASSPAIANGIVYLGSAGPPAPGRFLALSAATGALLYSEAAKAVDTDAAGFGSPVIANGWVYDTENEGGLALPPTDGLLVVGFTVPRRTASQAVR
jgi:outer membrane protein assembly factor BamB